MLTFVFQHRNSLSIWPRLHLHPTRPGRRPQSLRTSERTMEPHSKRGEDPDQCDEHAGRAER